MQTQRGFFRSVCAIAVPVTLQCLLQSSFSVIDQIMLGQLGGVSVAAFWWKLPVAQVYFLLSLEECVRFTLSVIVFRCRRWMRQLRPVSAAHG